MLHVRYPLPFARGAAASFRLVVFPPPKLVDARIMLSNDGTRYEIVQILSTRGGDTPQDQRLMSLWVAAGREDDYFFTLGVTLVVSVLGAMVMLRDISTLAQWD